jgi:hypothetical protein
MSEAINDGGAAFPSLDTSDWQKVENPGMTLRDYFAARAMTGLLACPNYDDYPERTAEACYRLADAMIAERGKSK